MIELDASVEALLRAARDGADLLSGHQLDAYYGLFRNKFGPDYLSKLAGAELLEVMHGRGSKQSLVHWLEFKNDNEFPSRRFGGIGGGSAHKFGIFHKEQRQWIEGSAQSDRSINVEEAMAIAQRQRDQLVAGSEILASLPSIASEPEYTDLQDDMQEAAPDLYSRGWAHKYWSLLFPEKIDDFHNSDWQRYELVKCLIVPSQEDGLFNCAKHFVAIAQRLGWRMNYLTTVLKARNKEPICYWRIGTKLGGTNSIWPAMQKESCIAIGWDYLGDLSEFADTPKLKDEIRKRLENDHPADKSLLGRKTKEIANFVGGSKIDDIVIASDGQLVLGIGRIAGQYEFDSGGTIPGAPHRRPVEWLRIKNWTLPHPNEGLRTTFVPIKPFTENSVAIERQIIGGTATEASSILQDQVSKRQYWIEKTLVSGRADRLTGDNRLGSALWSPQSAKNGNDIYANMRLIKAGDVIYHFTDNQAITGASIAASSADDTFKGVVGTEWAERPCYRVSLTGYVPLEPPLARDQIFNNPSKRAELLSLLQQKTGEGFFYNSSLELRQGAYLTGAPPELIALLNQAYLDKTGKSIPYAEEVAPSNLVAPRPLDTAQPYELKDALGDLFLDEAALVSALAIWRRKKNLIIQGPPGVGKTFIAERLAFLLMGVKANDRVDFIQFHQSYSYEDFIMGYRPDKAGFSLKDGRFLSFCERAARDKPDRPYVFIIDEINRGNLSKIFGELLMLIETDKRGERWSMPLAYSTSGQTFYVPGNVYLLGLMNTADRSLAVVDYALRRRFAFLEMNAQIASPKFSKHLQMIGIDQKVIDAIKHRVTALNVDIADDVGNLGRGFCIGHSFFCEGLLEGQSSEQWYKEIITSEIAPLLNEYWYDAPDKVTKWGERLLEGF